MLITIHLIKTYAGVKELMVLSAASTTAGNFTIIGAASNVIIIHTAERKLRKHNIIKFFDFIKVGIIVTFINSAVYSIFIYLV